MRLGCTGVVGVLTPSETKDIRTHTLCLSVSVSLYTAQFQFVYSQSTGSILAECEKRTGTSQWPSRLHTHHKAETDNTYRERETQKSGWRCGVASVVGFPRSLMMQDGYECMPTPNTQVVRYASGSTSSRAHRRENRGHTHPKLGPGYESTRT